MASYDFKSLLPSNATSLEKSIEEVMSNKYKGADVTIIKKLHDPWECPEAFLPWLAFAHSVDVWNDRWPEITKRTVIENAKLLHTRKGMTGGVGEALAALGVKMTMTSWQDMEPAGEIGTASFDVMINENINPDGAVLIDSQMIKDIIQTINRTKRLSVHYNFNLGLEMTTGLQYALSAEASIGTGLDAMHTETTVTRSAGFKSAASAEALVGIGLDAMQIETTMTRNAAYLYGATSESAIYLELEATL